LVLRHDPARPHRELLVLANDGEHGWQGDGPLEANMLKMTESLYARVRGNWTEHRDREPIATRDVVMQRSDRDVPTEIWLFPGHPGQLDVGQIACFSRRLFNGINLGDPFAND